MEVFGPVSAAICFLMPRNASADTRQTRSFVSVRLTVLFASHDRRADRRRLATEYSARRLADLQRSWPSPPLISPNIARNSHTDPLQSAPTRFHSNLKTYKDLNLLEHSCVEFFTSVALYRQT
ncbi:hypothetical protein J6590_079937 [Homalodisca vitripennis]|nr:hypothetical protein J6590_079937 [Homalodisca vitripennis]